MTSIQSNSTGSEGHEPDLFEGAKPAVTDAIVNDAMDARAQEERAFSYFETGVPAGSTPFGVSLRVAREARGLEISACGQALRLPSQLLRQLEMGEYGGIDYHVYLPGYLTKYGRHVGVDEDALQAELNRLTPREPTLVVSGGISHSRYLLERYTTAATYVVLTAVIVVPMIWLGVRGTLDRDMARMAPLDATPVAQQEAVAAAGSSSVAANPKVVVPAPPRADEQPLLASMAMFPSLDTEHVAAPKATLPVVAPVVSAGGHSLTLTLPSASWVEVTASDGSRLEYGLLPAGTEKTYHSDNPLEVRIGNATGAQVLIDGQPVGLDSFRRANVARFRVEIKGGQATPVGS
jgi:cytoskeleton protein RodZ